MILTTAGPVRPRVFLAEDDDDLRGMLTRILRMEGYSVSELEDGFELSDALAVSDWTRGGKTRPDAVLTDLRMPGVDGLAVIQRAREAGLTCPIIVMTGHVDEAVRAAVGRLPATHLLAKPMDLERMLGLLWRVVH